MKAHYAGREEEMPYKTLAGFRRARRAQAESYKDNKKEWNNKISDQSNKEKILSYNQEKIDSVEFRQHFIGVGNKFVVSVVIREARKCVHKNDKTPNERGVFIDEKGNSVYTFSGKNYTADFNETNLVKYKNNSLILVHNHPSGNSISLDDILTISDNPQIKTIIAVGHNGNVYKHSIGAGKRIDKSIVGEYNMLMKDKEQDTHKVMKVLAEKYGWRYEKNE